MLKFEKGTDIDTMIKKLRMYCNEHGIIKEYLRHQYHLTKREKKEIKLRLRQKHNNLI